MRKLTQHVLENAFRASGIEMTDAGVFWGVSHFCRKHDGMALREVLKSVRNSPVDVSIFVKTVLQPSDIDDVAHVIEALNEDTKSLDGGSLDSLLMLQSWRAKALMQIVIDKRVKEIACAS